MTNVVPIRPTEGTSLPIVLGGASIARCYRCGRTVVPVAWRVELEVKSKGRGTVCRYCCAIDPDLTIWGEYVDVTDAIDRLMRNAATHEQRRLLAQLLADAADILATWRWNEAGDDA